MRLVQFVVKSDVEQTPRVGVRNGDVISEVTGKNDTAPTTLVELLTSEPNLLTELGNLGLMVKMDEVKLLPPISGCDKVVCVGMNYKDHCEEQGCPVPKDPIFFSKFSSCLIGPTDPIPYPEVTEELDFEVELAVVVGKKGKNIPQNEAYDYILGYTVAHDVSARDWQLKKNGGQWLIGKSMDGFSPIGPEIVTTDEITDPHGLKITCKVNGEIKQDSNTNQIIHRVDSVVATLSKFVTLLPGDIILTGTPPGVGVFANPPFFLKRGDIVECEIENIGKIVNKVE